MLIPRGKDVDIPVSYFKVLENAVAHKFDALRNGFRAYDPSWPDLVNEFVVVDNVGGGPGQDDDQLIRQSWNVQDKTIARDLVLPQIEDEVPDLKATRLMRIFVHELFLPG